MVGGTIEAVEERCAHRAGGLVVGAVHEAVDHQRAVPAKQASVGAGETPLLAPIPGTIIRYLVKEGDEIKEGKTVVVLEAMKMENEIVAPVSGKIKAINFKPGDKVPGGAVLAIIG